MSMLSPIKQQLLDEIEMRYESGKLSAEEVSDRMLVEIEKEVQKDDVEIDDAWIDACYALMNAVSAEQTNDWPDQQQENWLAIQEKITKAQRAKNTWGTKRIISVAACLVLLLGGVSFSWTYLSHSQSADEQEYYITGDKRQFSFNDEARASDGELEAVDCSTQDFSELCEFLGFTPPMPTWIPDGGWVLAEYYGTLIGSSFSYGVVYENPHEKYILSYNYSYEEDPEHVSVTFFQDGAGHYIKAKNGKDVYITTNCGETVAIWHSDSTIEDLGGPISEHDVIRMVESIE